MGQETPPVIVNNLLHDLEDGNLMFFCPGCKCGHKVWIKGDRVWQWNGSYTAPTFTPSLLITYGGDLHQTTCHCFVTDGKIQFLGDSSHALAGQTVPMVSF